MLNQTQLRQIGFRQDNTEGYTKAELDRLNVELETRLVGLEPESDEWYDAAKGFADEVAQR